MEKIHFQTEASYILAQLAHQFGVGKGIKSNVVGSKSQLLMVS